ncbi:hypothetical protein DKX38_022548 [Salix brachista]|uniref:Mediator of RNA polymerase II transcription subunit 17 n=1 Tax=Salix brachista TaxID=2182728 RepID=A0A5N5JZW0_9ROSI|nr:hypothetical protein DKX38_022548 [Salix brachista]
MDGKLEMSLDKLPVKRLESIEENGFERFPTMVRLTPLNIIRADKLEWQLPNIEFQFLCVKVNSAILFIYSGYSDIGYDEKQVSLIRRIDFGWAVEANDAVTVAGMTRPKPLPNEILADLAVSTATKLQCYRVWFSSFLYLLGKYGRKMNLGKYFKQSAKALEQQVAREARFYGALIRLQQNWKVKRQRVAAIAPGNEGFMIDLFDNSLYDSVAVFQPSSLSTIRIDHNSDGMLAINLPSKSCHSLLFGFLSEHSNAGPKKSNKSKTHGSLENPSKKPEKESLSDNECVKDTHLLLRKVFEMVNRGAVNQSSGLNVTGIQENYVQLCIGPGISIYVSVVPSDQGDQAIDSEDPENLESAAVPSDSFDGVKLEAKGRPFSTSTRMPGQPANDGSGLLSHFCLSLSHRIISNKVLMELENVVCRVPYLHLISHPTWHSRSSAWTIYMKIPPSILHASSQARTPDIQNMKNVKSEFWTKVMVRDDCINIEAEGAPNVVGLFKDSSDDICSTNKYDCNLDDLPVIILQQVASQVIRWLHEEALAVGIKANRDFLCLSFELEQGEILSLVAHVDPEDIQGCISWLLTMEDSFAEEKKLHMNIADGASEYRKFLGYLPLDVLYSTLMDLVSLCGGGSH